MRTANTGRQKNDRGEPGCVSTRTLRSRSAVRTLLCLASFVGDVLARNRVKVHVSWQCRGTLLATTGIVYMEDNILILRSGTWLTHVHAVFFALLHRLGRIGRKPQGLPDRRPHWSHTRILRRSTTSSNKPTSGHTSSVVCPFWHSSNAPLRQNRR